VTTPTSRMLNDCAETHARLTAITERPSAAFPAAEVPEHFRRAAVLLLVGCHDGRPHLVLTERSARMRAHASEIALPGGRIEAGETPEQAAVREAMEEVGADPDAVDLLGRHDDAWSKAGNHVVPVVAWYRGTLTALAPSSEEVASVFLTALGDIASPEAHRIDVVEINGVTYENDVLDAGTFDIYGLTADLVMDLFAWLDGRERDRVPVRLDELARKLEREREAAAAAQADEMRAVVRAGYDRASQSYLADRATDSPDVAFLEEFITGLSPTARVLDAGCGAGVPVTQRLLAGGRRVVGLDFSAAQLALAHDLVSAASAAQGDLAHLPFAEASFDAVVSFYAIIHVPRADHPTVFAEVWRVLRPGGLALLCVGAADLPEDYDPQSWLGGPMYWSHYDAATNRELIGAAGLEIVEDRTIPDPMGHSGHLFVLARRSERRDPLSS
jgi:SAM-dependent methyltransferase/ADP-ribose pyrophosphatase YjhB (NUDIX family)